MIITLEYAQKIMRENGGNLFFRDITVESLPDGLIVEGYLYLTNAKIKSLPKGLKVGGSLYLCHSLIESLPDDLIVGGNLDLSYTSIEVLPKGLTVAGDIDLRYAKIKSLTENLVVAGDFDLSHTPIDSLPENLIVGGYLELGNTRIEHLPKDLILGGSVYGMNVDETQYKHLKNGDYVPGKYLYADNILTHVKSSKQINGYTFYIGKIKGNNVLSDGTNYAHCSTLREGLADILYKTSASRGAEQYEHLTKESIVTLNEAITMYRVITGACKRGTESFVSSQKELKQEYLVSEIIKFTRGQFGSKQFAAFFER